MERISNALDEDRIEAFYQEYSEKFNKRIQKILATTNGFCYNV